MRDMALSDGSTVRGHPLVLESAYGVVGSSEDYELHQVKERTHKFSTH